MPFVFVVSNVSLDRSAYSGTKLKYTSRAQTHTLSFTHKQMSTFYDLLNSVTLNVYQRCFTLVVTPILILDHTV